MSKGAEIKIKRSQPSAAPTGGLCAAVRDWLAVRPPSPASRLLQKSKMRTPMLFTTHQAER